MSSCLLLNTYTAPKAGSDGSKYYRNYVWTSQGDPIGMNEYTADIAGPSTQVIQLDDMEINTSLCKEHDY